MKKYLIMLLMFVFAISMIFMGTGCKEETSEVVEKTTETAEETEEEVSGETVTLTVWTSAFFPDPYKELYTGFANENPQYELDIINIPMPFEEAFLTKWAAGERPDIADWHMGGIFFPQLNPAENLVDLSGLDFVGKTMFNLLDPLTSDEGEVWGPVITAPKSQGIFYNKEVFADLNLEIPKNFDEFYELCGAIKDAGTTPLYVGGADMWPFTIDGQIWMTDGIKADPNWFDDINTGKTNFSQSVCLDAWEAGLELVDAGYYQDNFLTGSYEGSMEALWNGEAAMTFQGDWFAINLVENYSKKEVNEKIGFFGISLESNMVGWGLFIPGATVVVPKSGDAAKEEGGREFINYITGPAYQTLIDALEMPPVIEGFKTPEITVIALQEMAEAFEASNGAMFEQDLMASPGDLATVLQELYAQTKTPEEVAELMNDNFAENAAAQGLPGW